MRSLTMNSEWAKPHEKARLTLVDVLNKVLPETEPVSRVAESGLGRPGVDIMAADSVHHKENRFKPA